MGASKETHKDGKESGNQVLKVRCNEVVAFGLKKSLKGRHAVFLQMFMRLSYRTRANG